MHNGLVDGRGGLTWNGENLAITEGAKVDMQITNVTKPAPGSTGNMVVTWTASYNGTAVNPCNAVATIGAPVFHAATANATTGQAAGGLRLQRAYGELDDFSNAGISTSPGQPASTNLSTSNTSCASNVATTTIALTTPEVNSTSTKGRVAIQGRAQVKLPFTYDDPLTPFPTVEAKDVILVRSKSPTREFNMADGSLATARRQIVDTAGCLNCHVGSLYQHGGNRIDNMDLCVMCHNEASSEQNVRLLDGVDATEAYDGKVGMTYGFKSLLHAVHSANENNAITMCYRTNGNYVWTGEITEKPALYPTVDTDASPYDVIVGDGAAALIYGSSSPAGTGAKTVAGTLSNLYDPRGTNPNTPYDGTSEWGVYRAHNLYHPTYPQQLTNCVACHVPGTFGLPSAANAIATTVNAGTVALGGSKPNQNASNALNSVLTDDTVIGPSAAACFSCHQGSMAPIAPAAHSIITGPRYPAPSETCSSCH
jgi:hypothetical protein